MREATLRGGIASEAIYSTSPKSGVGRLSMAPTARQASAHRGTAFLDLFSGFLAGLSSRSRIFGPKMSGLRAGLQSFDQGIIPHHSDGALCSL